MLSPSSVTRILWNCVPDWRLVHSIQSTIWNISDVSVPYFGSRALRIFTEQSTLPGNHLIRRWKWYTQMKSTNEKLIRHWRNNQTSLENEPTLTAPATAMTALTAIQWKDTYEIFTSRYHGGQHVRKSQNLHKPKRVNSVVRKSIIPLQASTQLIEDLRIQHKNSSSLLHNCITVNRVVRFYNKNAFE